MFNSTNNVGYRIGGNYVLRHNGIPTNIYAGVGAGNSTGTGIYNTFAGNNAGNSNALGVSNTFIGHVAGKNNTDGSKNTFVGDSAGYSNAGTITPSPSGDLNTFVGSRSGFANINGRGNTFIGRRAGENNIGGRWNTFTGLRAGENNNGELNCFYGKEAGVSNTTGNNNIFIGVLSAGNSTTRSENVFIGTLAGLWNAGDSNVVVGNVAGYNNTGHGNAFMGYQAGYDNTGGNHNTYLGYRAQGTGTQVNSFTNSTALGANSYVTTNNTMILGDNNVNVGIGLSGNPAGLQAKLDVRQGTQPIPSTGTKGIQVLNTDNCNATTSSIGIYSRTSGNIVTTSVNPIAGWFESPVIPSASIVGAALVVPRQGGKVSIGFAGNFPAQPAFSGTFSNGLLEVSGDIWCNSSVTGPGLVMTNSDRELKTDTVRFSEGLNVVRNIDILSYRYNGKAFMPTRKKHLGVFAEDIQQLNEISEFALDTVFVRIDSTDSVLSPILAVNHDAIFFAGINAIKQLDSAVTAIQNNPGVSGTGTANFLTKWQNANTVTSSSVFDDGSNVGIGTTNPQQTLDVIGSLKVGSGVNLPTLNNGYGIFTSVPGVNAGFTINRGGNSSYASLDFVESGLVYTTGWSVQMAPYSEDLVMLDRTNNINIITLHHGGNMDVVGNIYATGTITQNSDAALKQNIDSINNALGIIAQLKPHTFNFDTTNYSYLNLPNGKQYGITAQEAETVLPEIVKQSFIPQMNDSAGNMVHPAANFKTVNYTALIPILLKAVKEQQGKITQLESMVSGCCNTNTKTNENGLTEIEKIKLTLPDAPVLGDARPNPNSGYTEIPYYLPENVSNAKIIFTDMLGRTMQEKNLQAGYGILGIDTNDLPNGIYTYTMLLNGKTFETKTMVKTK